MDGLRTSTPAAGKGWYFIPRSNFLGGKQSAVLHAVINPADLHAGASVVLVDCQWDGGGGLVLFICFLHEIGEEVAHRCQRTACGR